jgi:uncharacterized protein DUF2846
VGSYGRGLIMANSPISSCKEINMNCNWKRHGKYISYLFLVLVMVCLMVGCSATGKTFVPSTPTVDSGIIYIYRPSRFLGSGNVWDLRANGTRVTAVQNGGWFAYDSKPGSVTFYSKLRPGLGTLITALFMSEKEMITINVEAGEVYFVKFDHASKGPYMELVDKDKGKSEIVKLKMNDPLE